MRSPRSLFDERTVDRLAIDDERSLRHVALYADLKEVLLRSKYVFRVLPVRSLARADRATFLNLTFWTAKEGGDVLISSRIEADVVAHAAWHHVAARALGGKGKQRPTVEALFLGEAVASAFDVYLVGRLLGHAPRSSFLKTQVPAMAEAASAAGLSRSGFRRLLLKIVRDPDRAFAELRALLSDVTGALVRCRDAAEGHSILAGLESHPFASLLHRYELSNWILYARAFGSDRRDPEARAVDRALRTEKAPLEWLAARWIAPILVAPSQSRLRPH